MWPGTRFVFIFALLYCIVFRLVKRGLKIHMHQKAVKSYAIYSREKRYNKIICIMGKEINYSIGYIYNARHPKSQEPKGRTKYSQNSQYSTIPMWAL